MKQFSVTCPLCDEESLVKHPSFKDDIERVVGVPFQCPKCQSLMRVDRLMLGLNLAEVIPLPQKY